MLVAWAIVGVFAAVVAAAAAGTAAEFVIAVAAPVVGGDAKISAGLVLSAAAYVADSVNPWRRRKLKFW